jgi:hypothetical protein
MANNIWDNSDADNDANNPNNWSLGWVPKAGDTMYFDDTSDANCQLKSANISCDAVNLTAAYDGELDLNDYNLSAGDMTFAGAGEVKCGSGTHTCSGDLSISQGTWTRENSEFVLSGSGKTWSINGAKYMYKVTVTGSVTYTGPSTAYVRDIGGALSVSGTLTIDSALNVYNGATCLIQTGGQITVNAGKYLYVYGSADLQIQSGATLSGSGTLIVKHNSSCTQQDGTFSIANVLSQRSNSFVGAIYGGDWTIENEQAGTGHTCTLGTGASQAFVFTGDVTFDADTADTFTIDLSTYDPDLEFRGDVIHSETGGGTLDRQKGDGTMSFTGPGDQDIDLNDETVEDMVIDKSAGTVTFTDSWSADSFDCQAGTVDFNGDAFDTIGNFTIGAGGQIISDADAMNGVDITVGEDLSLSGQSGDLLTFNATAAWTLSVTGTATASYVAVAHCDASGGTTVLAMDHCTNNGDNLNWLFSAVSMVRPRRREVAQRLRRDPRRPSIYPAPRGLPPLARHVSAVKRRRISRPARRPVVLDHAGRRGKFYFDARGKYRIFNAGPIYRFYRSQSAPPAEGDTPFATSQTLPYTTAVTFGDGTWYLSVSRFDGVLDSGFLPIGPEGETYLRLEISGGQASGLPPLAPQWWHLDQEAGGVVRVLATYYQVDDDRADQWAITYTTDGSDPPANSPDLTPTLGDSPLAILDYDLPSQSHGTVVRVRLQTRRNDGSEVSPVWVYSEGSTIETAVADAQGPAAPAAAERWPGQLPEDL